MHWFHNFFGELQMTDSVQAEAKPSITIDGVSYELDSLTPQVRTMLNLYQRWTTQAQDLQTEFTKTDLAVKALGAEISKALAAPAEAAA